MLYKGKDDKEKVRKKVGLRIESSKPFISEKVFIKDNFCLADNNNMILLLLKYNMQYCKV
jgi:hypothetical protein